MIVYTNFFIVIVLSILLYLYIDSKRSDLIYVKSKLDNHNYLVRNLPDRHKSANLLSKCKLRISKLINYLQINFGNDPRVKRLIAKYNPSNISETNKGNKYTSYSVNKGEKIVLCLRSRDNFEKLIDINTLMFVSIHELGHIMTLSIGHTKEFWDNFKFLLKKSVIINIYKEINYSKYPKKYCGIEVTDSPLFNINI